MVQSMDRLNKIVLSKEELQYHYKSDKNIPIGIRGMVDDTLGVSKCGSIAVQLNSVIISFIESQRLTLSEKNCVVTHVGEKSKCNTVYHSKLDGVGPVDNRPSTN